MHWARAGLWVLYRDLRATAPRTELPMTQWACRACRRGFRSKKQLGVYHFKSHGRVATYRECIEGTECRSCGRQFWTTARLSTHLRDSQACVSGLRGRGMTAETIAPGIGSRKWRQTAVEQYNPTGQRGHDYCGGGDQKHRSQECAYKEPRPARSCSMPSPDSRSTTRRRLTSSRPSVRSWK